MDADAEHNTTLSNHPPLDAAIDSVNQIFEQLLSDNDLDAALKAVEPYASKSISHSVMKTFMLTINAFFSLDKNDIEMAIKSGEETGKICNSLRKKSFMKKMQKTNYDKSSDLQLHAKITKAKCLAIQTALALIENPHSVNLISVGLKMQKCMTSFKKCKSLFEKRTKWESDKSRETFESAVKLGDGCINLLISQVPPKIMKLLNFIGIKGDRDYGLQEIAKASEMKGVEGKLATFALMWYKCFMEMYNGYGDSDTTVPEKMVNKELQQYPNNLGFKLLKTTITQFNGKFDEGRPMYESMLQMNLPRGSKLLWFNLMWDHAIKLDWDGAIKYATLVHEKIRYSPAVGIYLDAVYRYTKAVEENNAALKDEATKLFETVIKTKIRSIPRVMTPDKIAVVLSQKYLEQQQFLCLPDIELLYQYNIVSMIGKNPEVFSALLQRVEKKAVEYKNNIGAGKNVVYYGYATFYRGVFLRLLRKYDEAIECFNEVINNESQYKKFSKERSLVPQAVVELGLAYMGMKQLDKAKTYLDKARKEYKGYMMESLLQFRIYGALRYIGVPHDEEVEDDDDDDESEEMKDERL